MNNLLIQQYGKYKRQQLDENPYSCLLDTSIDINPHQVDAFCAAVKALKTGGIILAAEVGLRKTIEAGLVIKYVIKSGAKKILIPMSSAADIATVPYKVLDQMTKHPLTDQGIAKFQADYKAVFGE